MHKLMHVCTVRLELLAEIKLGDLIGPKNCHCEYCYIDRFKFGGLVGVNIGKCLIWQLQNAVT